MSARARHRSSSKFLHHPPLDLGKKGGGVVVANPHAGIVPQKKQSIGPFQQEHKILTIGDGDLSFSLSLGMSFGGAGITATTYDSKAEVHLKYAHTGSNIRLLKQHGAHVYHNVDATQLREDAKVVARGPFHRIVFMFPHLGGATAEDVQINQQLIGRFLMAAKPLLAEEDGMVVIGLRDTPFYRRWELPKLAAILEYSHDVQQFNASDFIGYRPVRTNPAVREAPSAEDAQLHLFLPLQSPEKGPRKGKKRKRTSRDDTEEDSPSELGTPGKRPTDPPHKPDKPDKPTSGKPKKLRCEICGTPFSNLAKLNGHLNSRRHAQKFKTLLKEAKAAGGPLPPELANPQVPGKMATPSPEKSKAKPSKKAGKAEQQPHPGKPTPQKKQRRRKKSKK